MMLRGRCMMSKGQLQHELRSILVQMSSTRKQVPVPIALLGATNFFAALGGGTVLGKAMGVLRDEPFLKGDSLVAIVGGTMLGFLVLLWVKKWARPSLRWRPACCRSS